MNLILSSPHTPTPDLEENMRKALSIAITCQLLGEILCTKYFVSLSRELPTQK
jgi:hypothetical protein